MVFGLQPSDSMYRACIATVDATRARLFTYERVAAPEGTREQLVEHTDLVNPARRMRPGSLFSDSQPGAARAGSHQNAFDDHRDQHITRFDIDFARAALVALRELIDQQQPRQVILCAGPRMLGHLRAAVPGILPDGVEPDELARDLVKLGPSELRDQLASHDLLPRDRPTRIAG